MSLASFPLELKYKLFHHLGPQDLYALSKVLESVSTYIDDYRLEKAVVRYNVELFAEKWHLFYKKWMNKIIEDGCSLEVVQWMYENEFNYDFRTFAKAAQFGDLEIMKWLKENKFPYDEETFAMAGRNGNLDNMIWLHENKFPYDVRVTRLAVNSLSNLEWLISNNFPFDKAIYNLAASYRRIDVINWLKENQIGYNPSELEKMMPCVEYDTIENMRAQMIQGYVLESQTFVDAAKEKDYEAMEWLLEIDCPMTGNIIAVAVEKNDLEFAKWLHEKGCPLKMARFGARRDIYEYAVENSNYEILEWLIDQECPKSEISNVSKIASEKNDLEMMKWLQEKGFKLKCYGAYTDFYQHRNFEAMEWLYKNGFSFNFNMFKKANEKKDMEMIVWLLERDYKVDSFELEEIVLSGNMEAIKLVIEKGTCEVNKESFGNIIRTGNLELIQLFFTDKSLFNNYTMSSAVRTGNIDLVKWLIENECPYQISTGYSFGILDSAINTGNLEMVKFIMSLDENIDVTKMYENAVNSLDIMEYFLSLSDVLPDKETLCDAIMKRNFEVIKLLLDKGVPYDKYTILKVFRRRGYTLDHVKQLHELGLPLNDYCLKKAITHGNLELTEWLFDQGCTWNDDDSELTNTYNKFELTLWRLDLPDEKMDHYYHYNLDLMELLHEKGIPMSNKLILDAYKNGLFDVVKWLLNHGYYDEEAEEVLKKVGLI